MTSETCTTFVKVEEWRKVLEKISWGMDLALNRIVGSIADAPTNIVDMKQFLSIIFDGADWW